MLDLIGDDFNPTPYKNTDFTFFNTVPSTEEVRDKNANMMYSALVNNGFKISTMYKQCTDGEEYEIIEIRGPKASGFFYAKNFYFFLCECGNVKQQ